AEAQDPGIAPHQPERERKEAPDRQQGGRIALRHLRQQQEQQGACGKPAPRDAPDAEARAGHVELRKKRPVMPCGIRRSRTMARTSIASSPITGVEAKETIWSMVPERKAAERGP